jgi:hypothetical protein
MPEVTPVVDQLAGRDIAIILGIVLVLFVIYLIISQMNQYRQASAVDRLSKTIEKRTESDIIQTDAIKDMIATHRARTDIEDKVHQEIVRVGQSVNALSAGTQSLVEVTSELRKVAVELLDIAHRIEGKEARA